MKSEKRTGKPKKSEAASKPASKTKSTAKAAAEAAPEPTPAEKKSPPRSRKKLAVPPILLENDNPPPSTGTGPGQRYMLAPTAPTHHEMALPELPEAYGTRRLLLAARDPHWLYASWDLTREQLREYNQLSREGHLVLRVFLNEKGGQPFSEVHVHPESRNWFLHVGRSETRFVAELGFYQKKNGTWESISISRPTLTPPDTLSEETSAEFATIPGMISFQELLSTVQGAVNENQPLVEALREVWSEEHGAFPDRAKGAGYHWTPEQAEALSQLISIDSMRRVWMGSLEITELIRRRLSEETSSIAAQDMMKRAAQSLALGGISSISSPFGGLPRRKSFWFNINAELIIYGATEPDASVTIGGRSIRLRPDGTFSYRFLFPDGDYELPVIATSADGDDSRAAALNFVRVTEYEGDVTPHPQDQQMKPPGPQNVS
ncbi:MAG: DUF4912 domain-containing protein [Verrucomicrobiota bacterium]|nr:DUF4912 domain-containing protein [Verrucomicrobiota bacterium]